MNCRANKGKISRGTLKNITAGMGNRKIIIIKKTQKFNNASKTLKKIPQINRNFLSQIKKLK